MKVLRGRARGATAEGAVARRGNRKPYQAWPSDKARAFQRLLLDWYQEHRRELPWRSSPTPYRVWVSEIMLQQTRVRTVLAYFDKFIRRFPDIRTLAEASDEEVSRYWAGLGYYSRARNLHHAAQKIAREFAGSFPDSLEEILKLPGIGRYTAGAIYSIAFNRPQAVVDGNVRRVISRLHGCETAAPDDFFWRQAKAWLPPDRPSEFNQAVMELGALLCIPSRPKCPICPVQVFCEARRKGIQGRIPASRAKRAPEAVELVLLVLKCERGVLLANDRSEKYIPGKWGLPMQNLDKGRPPEESAAGLMRRICGRAARVRERGQVRHSISHRRILAHVFEARVRDSDLKLPGKAYRWIPLRKLSGILTSSLFSKALRITQQRGRGRRVHKAHKLPASRAVLRHAV